MARHINGNPDNRLMNKRLRKQLWYVAAGTVAILIAREFGPSLIRYLRLERM